jgi:toxin HigB-1
MICGCKDSRTGRLYTTEEVREFQVFARQADKRLRILDAADTLRALQMLPSNRLEALKGDCRGQDSIRINQPWRVYALNGARTARTTSRSWMITEGGRHGPHADPSWRNPQR